MIPITLQVRCNKMLQNLKNSIPTNKDLHLLIDLVKLEETPCNIIVKKHDLSKEYRFGFFILDSEDKRDEFFNEPKKYSDYFDEKVRRRSKKLSIPEIRASLCSMGFNVPIERIRNFMNPVKVRIILDKKQNKQDRRYYDTRNRS